MLNWHQCFSTVPTLWERETLKCPTCLFVSSFCFLQAPFCSIKSTSPAQLNWSMCPPLLDGCPDLCTFVFGQSWRCEGKARMRRKGSGENGSCCRSVTWSFLRHHLSSELKRVSGVLGIKSLCFFSFPSFLPSSLKFCFVSVCKHKHVHLCVCAHML